MKMFVFDHCTLTLYVDRHCPLTDKHSVREKSALGRYVASRCKSRGEAVQRGSSARTAACPQSHSCKIDFAGAGTIASCLKNQSKLNTLDLSKNIITPLGARALAACLTAAAESHLELQSDGKGWGTSDSCCPEARTTARESPLEEQQHWH